MLNKIQIVVSYQTMSIIFQVKHIYHISLSPTISMGD